MKQCPNCKATYEDETKFCIKCGTVLEEFQPAPAEEAVVNEQPAPAAEPAPAPQPEPQPTPQQPVYQAPPVYAAAPAPAYQAPVDPDDHTAEMDEADIAESKLYAILVYLLGPVGMIVGLLAQKDSKFLDFHIRLNIKYLIVNTILVLLSAVFCWTFVIPIAGAICMCIVAVLMIISFVQCCKGKAKDPAIIKKIKFLK